MTGPSFQCSTCLFDRRDAVDGSGVRGLVCKKAALDEAPVPNPNIERIILGMDDAAGYRQGSRSSPYMVVNGPNIMSVLAVDFPNQRVDQEQICPIPVGRQNR